MIIKIALIGLCIVLCYCDSGKVLNNSVEVDDKFYYAQNMKMNWYDAHKYCDNLGLKLASITSAKEQYEVTKYLLKKLQSGTITWLDGTDFHEEKKWIWSISGEEMIFNAWAKDEPNNRNNEDCLVIKTVECDNWNDISCDRNDVFVLCQYTNITDSSLTSTLSPSSENNDQRLSFAQENGPVFLTLFVLSIITMIVMIITFFLTFKRMRHQYLSFRTKYCGILERVDHDVE